MMSNGRFGALDEQTVITGERARCAGCPHAGHVRLFRWAADLKFRLAGMRSLR